MTTEKVFPIMVGREGTAAPCPSWIPWDAIAPYEGHALANHDQTLERLAQRGGLSPEEAYLVMTGRRWKGETFNKAFEIEACNFLDKIVRDRGELQRQLAVANLEIGDLKDALERARTYTGLEAQGCPLCTYEEGVFKASCSFHQKLAAAELQSRELLMALDRTHDPGRCPYNSYGKCWACVALKKYGDQMPDQHLAVCSVCKELIEDTFSARKAAWCEKCEGYSHNNCWPAHNLNYCRVLAEKPKEECTMNCLTRWPDMGHHPECPTRKCAKHGLTVCDECAGKRVCSKCGNIGRRQPHDEATCDYGNV